MSSLVDADVEKFFAAIGPIIAAYDRQTFTYVAVKSAEKFEIRGANLTLGVGPSPIPFSHFESENVKAGQYRLDELASSPRDLLNKLLSGSLKTPHGELAFSGGSHGRYSSSFIPFNRPELEQQSRVNVLTIVGGPAPALGGIEQTKLDWELKAAEQPYDSLQELMLAFHCYDLALQQSVYVVVVAHHVAVVDLSVAVAGKTVKPRIFLARELSPDKAQLGYRVYSKGIVVTRGRTSGADMEWSPKDEIVKQGEFEMPVPGGAVVHCVASYDGMAQHFGWLMDPMNAQNPKRAIYTEFDANMEALQDFLAGQRKAEAAGDFETGVRWLLWMLGFSVADLGSNKRTSDAPDLIAVTPNGHVAVIECTIGMLKADYKLSKLQIRTAEVRRRLQESGNGFSRVLPVIVTAKTRADVEADAEQAEKWGICVLTRENLVNLIGRTHPLANADALYTEAEQTVSGSEAPAL